VLCPPHNKSDTLAYLQLIASVDLFKGFAINQALELLLMSHRTKYKAGDVIAQEGTPGDKFIIIMQGEASVSFGNVVKIFKAGDYLGEISVVTGAKRTATITSHTDSLVVEVDKYAFSYFLFKDRQLARRMNNLVKARLDGSWKSISANSVLRNLSTNQKTSLQALLTMKKYKLGEIIYKCGEQAKEAVLISQGELLFAEIHSVNPKDLMTATRHTRMKNISMQEEAMLNIQATSDVVVKYDNMAVGAFICDTFAMNSNSPLTMTLVCASAEATLFLLQKDAVLSFLDNSPMLLLALLKTIVLL
jgi:CRP-like cAMP-binding protein